VLGDELRYRIEEIFARNEMTPAAVAGELNPIADRVNALDNAVNQVLQSFEFFAIGSDELAPGEFEIGFLIPRPAVDDALRSLGLELVRLQQRILGPFLEVTTGTREDSKIRSVSSSTIHVLLESHQATAVMVAMAVERVIAAYKKVMEIRVAYQQLKDAKVPETVLAPVEAEAESRMQTEIDGLVDELLTEVKATAERQNELRKEFKEALNAIANRIDRGYVVEVRAGELPPAPDDEEESPEDRQRREAVEGVRAKLGELRFTNTSGAPILQLPEGDQPDGEGA
jgi:hypothetical protein